MKVAVVGAGIIGLTCAYELARAGHDVEVFDVDPAGGATHAAAGMLAPAGESWFGEEELLGLGLASAALWPAFAAGLTEASGFPIDLRTSGTLFVGRDRDDRAVVDRTAVHVDGAAAERLDRVGLLELEPRLNDRIAGGVSLPGDHSVNPRLTAAALIAVLGTRLRRINARPVIEDGICRGIATDAGDRHESDAVLLATGHLLDELLPGTRRMVRPVRGEILVVRTDDPPEKTIRAIVRGRSVYVVPREGGRVVIGATSEEHGGEPHPTVGGVMRLLHDATEIVPTLDRADIVDITCRFRPGTPDNGPLIGPTSVQGLLVAGGHNRGGVLLAPLTAAVIRAHLEGGTIPASAVSFHPGRFATERSSV